MSDTDRRTHVLASALLVFARYGYRKASMDDVARAADISRPGLYFYFSSKSELFRATVRQSLDDSITAAQQALTDPDRPLRERLIEAFDQWAGRYVGPMAEEIGVLIDSNPDLLDTMPVEYPRRFLTLVADAVQGHAHISPVDVARTLVSTSIGIKHDVRTRDEFVARMTVAIDLYCGRSVQAE